MNNSSFELLQDIFQTIDFNYNEEKSNEKDKLGQIWKETVGEKISKYSKFCDLSKNDIVTIACSDSIVANELYLEEQTLTAKMNEKAEKLGIVIKGLKFDYKKWKEKNDE